MYLFLLVLTVVEDEKLRNHNTNEMVANTNVLARVALSSGCVSHQNGASQTLDSISMCKAAQISKLVDGGLFSSADDFGLGVRRLN